MPHTESYPDTQTEDHNLRRSGSFRSGGTYWLVILLFLTASSALFSAAFEYDRYQIVAGPKFANLSIFDKTLVFWLLTAVPLAYFLPVLPILGALVRLQFRRTAAAAVNAAWVIIFYLIAADLISVGFAGNHISDYLPYLKDILASPDQRLWQWAGERLTTEAGIVFGLCAVAGPLCFVVVWLAGTRLAARFTWLASRGALAVFTAVFFFGVVGIVPALGLFSDRLLLDRIYAALPLGIEIKESLEGLTEQIDGDQAQIHALAAAPLPASILPRDAGRDRWLRSRSAPVDPFSQEPGSEPLLQHAEAVAKGLLHDAVHPGPVDCSAVVKKADLPNIIMIIFESFRHTAVSPGHMKRLDAWSKTGLRLQRHYSGSNCSHLGLFSLLYSRFSLGYHRTLDQGVPPQMLESLRRSGYRITYLTSGEIKGFRRVDQFINERYCDDVITEGQFSLEGMKDWPDSDRGKLAKVRDIVNSQRPQAQFLFFYLVSSHYRYAYPDEFAVLKESASLWQFLNPREQIRNHFNRYTNSVLFLEHEVMKFIQSIDPKRNIIIVTSDHGESIGEDGVFTHASRMSEIQMRVPFIMAGPGVAPREISTATVHTDVLPTLLHALAGKPFPVANSHGRDLMAETAPADEVAVTRPKWPEWDGVVIISGDKRLLFRARMDAGRTPSIEFAGLLDEFGHYELKIRPARHASGSGR